MTDDPEPWGFRGGLSGEFQVTDTGPKSQDRDSCACRVHLEHAVCLDLQRMLPCHGNRDLFRHPPATAVYSIRPHRAEDAVRMLVRRRDTLKEINVSCIDVHFFSSWRCKGFGGSCRAQERARRPRRCSRHSSVMGKNRVPTVMENLEKSWNFKMGIYRPGKVMGKT
ncbi:hypothetical protein EYF80_068244 [Liparis tanakae]|uniref:Uncharacterized protein n=1 Tax=Liparis tanakae TaxID=230148 RepID=A0A4Z2DYL9_9TELE|nr:hypothetical protein EYF80_068244 [Liparis tanakae]